MKSYLNLFLIAFVVIIYGRNLEGVTIERIIEPIEFGEGPHWDQRSQKLYFVNAFANKINSFNIATKKVYSADIKNGPVLVVIPIEGSSDKFIVGSGRDVLLVTWNGNSNSTNTTIQKLASIDVDRNDTRCNDGKVDSTGRLWIGTMGPEIKGVVTPNRGSLYSIGSDLKPKKQISPVNLSNGIAWNTENNIMFYIDSPTRQIVAYDFDAKNGTITNKRIIFDLAKNNITGTPDGMTIDTNDNLWIALHGGGRVIRVDPKQGKMLSFIELPVKLVTSVAFGGPQFDILYVTTSMVGLTDAQKQQQPMAGALFAVKDLGVKGRSANMFKLST